ncbi:hypothetical protein BRC97_00210 [Halobacteriales archaeon QS_6_71_20]|nr:MAG: hypothetical protein BRC97_00210 [Halobacteriales archaeon QS_6_71_20]
MSTTSGEEQRFAASVSVVAAGVAAAAVYLLSDIGAVQRPVVVASVTAVVVALVGAVAVLLGPFRWL